MQAALAGPVGMAAEDQHADGGDALGNGRDSPTSDSLGGRRP